MFFIWTMISWKRLVPHIAYWLIAGAFLVIFTGDRGPDILPNSVIVLLILPVAVGTSCLFNYFLIPRYLWKEKYAIFLLYSAFTVILSLWITMMVVLGTFIFLAEYQLQRLTPVTSNVLILGVALYFLILMNVLLFLMRRWSKPTLQTKVIHIRSARRTVPLIVDEIYFIESLSNYVKIHTEKQEYITKQTISQLQKELESFGFIRVHRSYLVNKAKITSYNREAVEVKSLEINFGRAFKKQALHQLT
jgi:hypothetical protein